MKFSVSQRLSTVSLLALVALAGCQASVSDNASLRARGESYIRANITELSPRSAELGGTFRVTDVDWEDDDTAIVTYEDGHISLRARTDVSVDEEDEIAVSRFRIDADNASSSGMNMSSSAMSASAMSAASVSSAASSKAMTTSSAGASMSASMSVSASTRARAKAGEFCGGIAGILCESGYSCQYEGSYPDAGGTCVKS